jgi:hypothetical protein
MGYVYRDFDNEIKWYTGNFNFVPSDILHHWDFSNMDVMTFMHLDLGKTYTDHHVLFLQRAQPEVKKSFIHHSSFEVADFDTQLLGHQWLAKKGWKSVWGVGRHVLGSQIFDYWQDPTGFKIEHYADGDLVNIDTPMTRDVVGPFSIWGPASIALTSTDYRTGANQTQRKCLKTSLMTAYSWCRDLCILFSSNDYNVHAVQFVFALFVWIFLPSNAVVFIIHSIQTIDSFPST